MNETLNRVSRASADLRIDLAAKVVALVDAIRNIAPELAPVKRASTQAIREQVYYGYEVPLARARGGPRWWGKYEETARGRRRQPPWSDRVMQSEAAASSTAIMCGGPPRPSVNSSRVQGAQRTLPTSSTCGSSPARCWRASTLHWGACRGALWAGLGIDTRGLPGRTSSRVRQRAV